MDLDHDDGSICCLCGQSIAANPADLDDALSMDHVPPKQFYPQETRSEQNPNLWLVPTHKRCNNDYRKDEEYFYHALYIPVLNNNPAMAQTIYRDLMRRTKKPQTPAMARSLLKKFSTITAGGIHLPPGILKFNIDEYRMQRVAIKIAQGLFYRNQKRYVPCEKCKDIRLCESMTEVPELYQLSWPLAEEKFVIRSVFSYWYFEIDNLHLFSMFFWESFMICVTFEEPSKGDDGHDEPGSPPSPAVESPRA